MVDKTLLGIIGVGVLAFVISRQSGSNSISINNLEKQKAFNLSELQGASNDLISNTQSQIDNLVRPVLKNSFGRFDLNQHERKIKAFNLQKSSLVKELNNLMSFKKSLNNDDNQSV